MGTSLFLIAVLLLYTSILMDTHLNRSNKDIKMKATEDEKEEQSSKMENILLAINEHKQFI